METQISYFDRPEGNPYVDVDQRAVIDSLKLGEAKDILPGKLYRFYQHHKDTVGIEIQKLDRVGSRVLKIEGGENGIAVLKYLERRASRKNDGADVFEIKGLYYADAMNGTAWNASQLWEKGISIKPEADPHGQLEAVAQGKVKEQVKVIETDKKPQMDFYYGAVMIRLNTLYDDLLDKEAYGGTVPMKKKILFGFLGTAHECGHRYQENLFYGSPDDPDVQPKKELTQEDLEDELELERNAQAFAFGVQRRLKKLGLDIARD